MREIKYIVLHCTATNQKATIQGIQNYWKSLGWKNPGYHYIISPNGLVTSLQPISMPSNGVAGYNAHSIHISYIGGIDASGNPLDNRTNEQRLEMLRLVTELKQQFPNAEIKGHRDFPNVQKACPSFEVKGWLKEIGLG